MADLGELQYKIEADSRDATAAIDDLVKTADKAETHLERLDKQAEKASQTFNKKLSSSAVKGSKAVLGFATAAAAAGAALATFSVKEAAEFQTRMTNVSTLLDVSTEEMDRFGDAVLDLSRRVPVSGSVLSESLYDVVSAGITDSADAMEVLEQAAKLGSAGIGTTASATDVLTSALNAFQLDADSAESVSNVLFETVRAGKTTIDELAQSFGQVAPAANAAGVTFEELQAATAALTTSGLSTSVAQTQLRALFIELNREGTKLDKAFESIGVSNVKAAVQADGFVEVMSNLQEELDLTDVELQNLFGSVEAGGAAISLLGAQNEAFSDTLSGLTDDVSSLDAAFEKQTATLKSQTQLFKNELNRVLINAATNVLPILTDALADLRQFIDENSAQIERFVEGVGKMAATILEKGVKAISSITQFFLENEKAIYIAAGAITAALIPAIVSMVAAAAPAIASITALAAAGGLLVFFGTEIVDGINGLISGMSGLSQSTERVTDDIEEFANEGLANITELAIKGENAFRTLALNGGRFTDDLADDVIANAEAMKEGFGVEIEKMVNRSLDSLETLKNAGFIDQAQVDASTESIKANAESLEAFSENAAAEVTNLATQAADIQSILDDLPEIEPNAQFSFEVDEEAKAKLEEQLGLTLTPEEFLTAYKEQLNTDLAEITDQLKIAQNSIATNAAQVAAESNAQLVGLAQRLRQDIGAIDADQTEEILQNALTLREGVVSEANAQYEGILAATEQLRLVGEITDEQAQEIISTAQNQRDQTVQIANEEATEILNSVREYANERGLIFDRENNELLTKQELFWKSVRDTPGDLLKQMGEIIAFIVVGIVESTIDFFTDLFVTLKAIFYDFPKFLIDRAPEWFQAAKDLVGRVIDAAKDLPSQFLNFGRDTIQGFIDGLTAKYTEAVASVTQFGQNIIAGVKKTLGIQSPSKVFREFGGNTAEGFLLGFQDGQQDSLDAMENFVKGLTSEASKLDEDLDFTRAFEELQRVVEDAFENAEDAVREFARENQKAQEDIRDDIAKTEDSIKNLKTAFEEDVAEAEADFTTDAAEIVLGAQARLEEIAAEIQGVKIETNIARAEGGNTADLTQQTRDLEAERAEQLAIIRSASDLELNLSEEIARQKEFNSLNELEQLAFRFEEEKRRREEAFNAELLELETQKQALQVSLSERESEWQEFTESLQGINEDFTSAYQDELTTRETLTKASVDKLVAEYARLEAAARSARSAGANISGVGGFAEGGFTGFGQDNEVAGVVHKNEYVLPAWLTKSMPNMVSMLEGIRTGAEPAAPVTNQNINFNVENHNRGNADMYRDIQRMRWMSRFAF